MTLHVIRPLGYRVVRAPCCALPPFDVGPHALASLREIEEVYLRTDDWRDDDRRVAFASLREELQRQCEDLIRG